MLLGPFGCLTKLGAQRAELVQKFVARSRVGIFHNERTRSTPLDPKLTFWHVHVWVHSRQIGCLTKLGAKQAELVQKFVTRSRVGMFSNEHSRSTPLDPKLTFLVRFVLFECIWDCLVALRNSVQNGPNKCKSSFHSHQSQKKFRINCKLYIEELIQM